MGAYDQTITLATSDPAHPARTLHVQGTITAATGDTSGGVLLRPLDVPVTVTGSHSQGEWVDFTHSLGPDAASLQPVKVYSSDYVTLLGIGKYNLADTPADTGWISLIQNGGFEWKYHWLANN